MKLELSSNLLIGLIECKIDICAKLAHAKTGRTIADAQTCLDVLGPNMDIWTFTVLIDSGGNL